MKLRLEDLPALAGRRFAGEPFRVTRDERDAFERLTWIDQVYTEPDPPEFPADIVEGFHTLALLDFAVSRVQPIDPASAYAYNYGLERVRFTAPILIGDLVRPAFEVVEVRPRGEGLRVVRHCSLTVDGAERPALVADWLVLYLPRH